jgi:elongation factor 2
MNLETQQTVYIKAKAVRLMYHAKDGQEYLLNLIDTPGHVDFTGKVTRALRAIDGAIVVVDAVEEIMAQTEVVTRQALEERVRPVLFINKVDRAIRELKLTPEQLQKRLANIVIDVNKFIQRHVEPQFKDKWIVKVEDGSVAFGSALKNGQFQFRICKDQV